MKSLYAHLDLVRPRPGMYIGNGKISTIRAYIDWYFGCLWEHNIVEPINPSFDDFHDWIKDYYGYYESTSGWNNMILNKSKDEEDALKTFFILLDKFRAGLSPEEARKEKNG